MNSGLRRQIGPLIPPGIVNERTADLGQHDTFVVPDLALGPGHSFRLVPWIGPIK